VLSYKFFIDLSVPRSIEADVENVPGVLVYNIDAIHSKASAALEQRLAAVPHVRAIIAESIAGLSDWTKEMMVSPIIQRMKAGLEQLRQEELDRFQKKVSAEEAKRLDDITRSLMQKVLKQRVLQLKAVCRRDDAEQLIEVLTDMFDLEKQPATS
jgi:glutamyl-tRNA reductase